MTLSIDWLNITLSDDRQEIITYLTTRLSESLGVEFASCGGAHGYESSQRAEGVLIAFGGEWQRGTLLLSLSGVASAALQWYGLSALLRALIKRFQVRLRCTRVDIALDVAGERWRMLDDPAKVYPRLMDGRIQNIGMYATYKRQAGPILAPEDNDFRYDGFTLYVGSRTSERMLRIYRKDIHGKTRTRIEYELKERYAAQVLLLMLSGGTIFEAFTLASYKFLDLTGIADNTALIEGYSVALPKKRLQKQIFWMFGIASALSQFVDDHPREWHEILVSGREKRGLPPYGNTGVHFESLDQARLFTSQFDLETTGSPYGLDDFRMDAYVPRDFF